MNEAIWTAIGTLLGAFIAGVCGLLAARYSSYMLRQRDISLREQERRDLAVALRGELLHMRYRFAWRWRSYGETIGSNKPRSEWDWTLPSREIFNANRERLGLFKARTVVQVVNTYGLITDYAIGFQMAARDTTAAQWGREKLETLFKKCGITAYALGKIAGLSEAPYEVSYPESIDEAAEKVLGKQECQD